MSFTLAYGLTKRFNAVIDNMQGQLCRQVRHYKQHVSAYNSRTNHTSEATIHDVSQQEPEDAGPSQVTHRQGD